MLARSRAGRLCQPGAAAAAALARAHRTGRGVRDRARVRDAARRGHVRRRARPPASTGRSPTCDAAVLDALRLGAHQLLSMRVPPHAAVGTSVELVRARVGQRAGRASSTPCCAGSPATTCPAGCAGSRPTRRRTRWASRSSPTRTRAGSSRRSARRWRADAPTPSWRAAGRRQLAAEGHARRAAGAVQRRRARGGRRLGPTAVAVRRPARSRRPGASCRGRAGPRRRAGRGVPAGRARPGAAAVGRAATSAGWTCARDRAASRPCSRRWPVSAARGCWPPSGAAPGPSRRLGDVGGRDRSAPAWSPRTARPPWRDGGLRPGARRRALHRARCAAPSAGGPLAAHARRPRGAGPAPARAARRSASARCDRAASVAYVTCSPRARRDARRACPRSLARARADVRPARGRSRAAPPSVTRTLAGPMTRHGASSGRTVHGTRRDVRRRCCARVQPFSRGRD